MLRAVNKCMAFTGAQAARNSVLLHL